MRSSPEISAFMNPRVSDIVFARRFESIDTFARRYAIPFCFASFSVRPTWANSGSRKVHDGTWRPLVVRLAPARLWRAGAVAHCPHTGSGRLKALVHLYVPGRRCLDSDDFEAHIFCVGCSTSG